MNAFLEKLRIVFQDAQLRRQILFVLGALVLFRLGASIPVPGVDVARLEGFLANNQFFGLLNIFSGGGLSNLSIMMLGVGPFITASIIMQLLTMIFPKLKEMYHEEGEAGRMKIAQYSRLMTIPLAILQGFGLLVLLRNQGVLVQLSLFDQLVSVIVVAAGSILLMWIGELINEFGIGNGVSLIIFAGIVAGIPAALGQALFTFEAAKLPLYIAFVVVAAIIIAGVVVITEAERPIPVSYAKRVRGNRLYGGISTYLPIRVNQAGVIPIIFALSILLMPQMVLNFLTNVDNQWIQSVSNFLNTFLQNPWIYAVLYFVLVFLFTYFYTAVTFDPQAISTNLQKSGAFVPGIRPGGTTADYLSKIITRLTLVGAVFLGVIAVLPLAMRAFTGIASLAIGGTALLIVVSVVLEFVKQINAQVSMREY